MKNKTKLLVLMGAVFFLGVGCQNDTGVVQGDLYFVLLDTSNYYVISEERRRTFKNTAEALMEQDQDSLNSTEKELVGLYRFLNKNGILSKPKIFIRKRTNEIEEVYLPLEAFERISKYKLKKLKEKQQRVYLEIAVDTTVDGLLSAKKILKKEKRDGQTHYKQ